MAEGELRVQAAAAHGLPHALARAKADAAHAIAERDAARAGEAAARAAAASAAAAMEEMIRRTEGANGAQQQQQRLLAQTVRQRAELADADVAAAASARRIALLNERVAELEAALDEACACGGSALPR